METVDCWAGLTRPGVLCCGVLCCGVLCCKVWLGIRWVAPVMLGLGGGGGGAGGTRGGGGGVIGGRWGFVIVAQLLRKQKVLYSVVIIPVLKWKVTFLAEILRSPLGELPTTFSWGTVSLVLRSSESEIMRKKRISRNAHLIPRFNRESLIFRDSIL